MDDSLKAFLASIDYLKSSYTVASISMLAAKVGSANHLLDARIILGFRSVPPPIEKVENEYIVAGMWQIDKPLGYLEELTNKFATRMLKTPLGDILLPGDETTKPRYNYRPFHYVQQIQQSRINALIVEFGSQSSHPMQPNTDWALRASNPPFDNLSELKAIVGLESELSSARIEIVALSPAMIDGDSIIEDDLAKVKINIAAKLNKRDISLGYRELRSDKTIRRGSVNVELNSWEEIEGRAIANVTIGVSAGSILQCFLNIKGTCVHFWWVSDARNASNPRLAIYGLFDQSLSFLKAQSFQTDERRADAREFESAFSFLLWIHGFNVMNFGRTKKLQDGADVIAETPSGRIAVIECTTGVLKSDKISQLVARTEKLKSEFQRFGNNSPTILPVLVTARSGNEVLPDIADAHRKGVAVISKENIDRLLQTAVVPNQAEHLYDETLNSIVQNQLQG